MWAMAYPIIIIVASNVLYNVCTKSTPQGVNAFASLVFYKESITIKQLAGIALYAGGLVLMNV